VFKQVHRVHARHDKVHDTPKIKGRDMKRQTTQATAFRTKTKEGIDRRWDGLS
jgi:hypothetical protein